MTCPLENKMETLLETSGIAFTRPDRDKRDPTTLDFFLPAFQLYIEVKQFHTDRIARQLAQVPPRMTTIVLVGPKAVEDFARLCDSLSGGGGATFSLCT